MTTTTITTWTARSMSALAAAFLAFDGALKFTDLTVVHEATAQLGVPLALNPTIGTILLACVALYVFPPTAILGAILLTGYLGGAVATHLRVGNPLATHTLFPTYVGLLVWGGLYGRDPRLRALVPWRTPNERRST